MLGIPLGLGKPKQLVNAFFRRAADDPGLRLTIATALTLTRPRWKSELERRLVEPMGLRLFGGYLELLYATARDSGAPPPNVEVRELYFAPGSQLDAKARGRLTPPSWAPRLSGSKLATIPPSRKLLAMRCNRSWFCRRSWQLSDAVG